VDPVVASRTGGIPEILTGEFQSGLFEPEMHKICQLPKFCMNWQNKSPDLSGENAVSMFRKVRFRQND